MISTSTLEAVTTIVSHDNCPDGTASAILLHDALPNAAVKFVQYGSDAYKSLPAEPGMLFCDMSPPAERVQEFVAAGAVVLDHHKYAKPVVEAFGENGVFADEATEPGVCGAVLAYRHVWKPLVQSGAGPFLEEFVDKLATLAGIRDTWQRRDYRWNDACAQASVLSFIPNEQWLSMSLQTIRAAWGTNYDPLGKLLVEKKNADVARACEKGWRFKTGRGTRIIILPGTGVTSDAAELLDDAVDLVVGFAYTYEQGAARPQIILSTRSHMDFDCGAFCKAHGGGGHTKAAGCSFEVSEIAHNPYTFIEVLLRGYDTRPLPPR